MAPRDRAADRILAHRKSLLRRGGMGGVCRQAVEMP